MSKEEEAKYVAASRSEKELIWLSDIKNLQTPYHLADSALVL